MSDTRQPGRIGDTFYGKEDHGILTVTVAINFKCSTQGFGRLAFKDKYEADDFSADLCATFGVKHLADLKGKRCVALRCFGYNNEPIEALEASDGKRFVINEWRRKHYPNAPTALEARGLQIDRKITFLRRQIAEETAQLKRLVHDYRPVEPTR